MNKSPLFVKILFILILIHSAVYGAKKDFITYTFQHFTDNNEVLVQTNTININKSIGKHFIVDLSYLVDGITGASRTDNKMTAQNTSDVLDGVTSASKEKRHEWKGLVTGIYDFSKFFLPDKENYNPTAISVSGKNSMEDDYISQTIGVSISQDLFQRNTTLGIAYAKSFDNIDPEIQYSSAVAADEGWKILGSGRKETQQLLFNIVQGITKKNSMTCLVGYMQDYGYLAKPYYVYEIGNRYYHESYPIRKNSMTYAARFNQYLSSRYGSAVHCDYRYYHDSWDMQSHTFSCQFYYRFAKNVSIRPSYRIYRQTSAFFYKDVYTEELRYLAINLKYRECITNTLGLKLSYMVKEFIKPKDNLLFTLYPVSLDIALFYMTKNGPDNQSILKDHYCYWPAEKGYRTLWLQTGIRFAY